MAAAIRVDDTLLARLEAEARRRGVPLEELVERALREHLDARESVAAAGTPATTFGRGAAAFLDECDQ